MYSIVTNKGWHMLKVIIADDERIQREGMMEYINWDDYGMAVVGCAADGCEALELVRMHMPDILITDIKMPKMDGLELSKRAREILPDIKILIVSGYDEFEFARKALELNACSYILKPLNKEKIREGLEKVGLICKKDLLAREEHANLKRQLDESKPLLVEKFFKELLYGFLKDENIIKKRSEFLSIVMPSSGYYVLLFQVDDFFEQDISEEMKQMFFLGFSVYLSETSISYGKSAVVQHKECEFVLILYGDSIDDVEVPQIADCIRECLCEKFGATVTLGVSNRKKSFLEADQGYKEAQLAARQKYYLGKGSCILFTDIDYSSDIPVKIDEIYEKLLNGIGVGNADKVEEMVDGIFCAFSRTSRIREQYVKAFCFRLMSDIYKILYDMNEKMENIFDEEDILWSKIYRFDTIPDVRQWVKNIINTVTQYVFCKRSRKNSSVVDTITRILEEKYYEQVTIDELAKKVYLTPSYICILFKENKGESIIDYLTRVRLKHAQRLLADNSVKIYEVAERTGFNSTSYFSIVFKNAYGISPKDYRDTVIKGENHGF